MPDREKRRRWSRFRPMQARRAPQAAAPEPIERGWNGSLDELDVVDVAGDVGQLHGDRQLAAIWLVRKFNGPKIGVLRLVVAQYLDPFVSAGSNLEPRRQGQSRRVTGADTNRQRVRVAVAFGRDLVARHLRLL